MSTLQPRHRHLETMRQVKPCNPAGKRLLIFENWYEVDPLEEWDSIQGEIDATLDRSHQLPK
jgi:hypothetical protein